MPTTDSAGSPATGPASLVVDILRYEAGEATVGQTLSLFSHLISTGAAWQLQGSYGRAARDLIDDGLLEPDGTLTIHAHDLIARYDDTDPEV